VSILADPDDDFWGSETVITGDVEMKKRVDANVTLSTFGALIWTVVDYRVAGESGGKSRAVADDLNQSGRTQSQQSKVLITLRTIDGCGHAMSPGAVFAVSSVVGGELKVYTGFFQHGGFLGAGGELDVAQLTLEQAFAHCSETLRSRGCRGFTVNLPLKEIVLQQGRGHVRAQRRSAPLFDFQVRVVLWIQLLIDLLIVLWIQHTHTPAINRSINSINRSINSTVDPTHTHTCY
jgi:hypothetical protein